jgi:ornithine cyclodeaminase
VAGNDPMDVLILSEAEVRAVASRALALEAARTAFRSLADGGAQQPPSIGLEIPELDAEMHVKGAYLSDLRSFAFKAASAFYRNRERGLPVLGGLSVAFDAETGFVRCILLDNGYLTELRTGAAGALAADLLSAPESEVVAIVGSGGQARFQLSALLEVRHPQRVVIWGRHHEHAESFAEEVRVRRRLRVDVAGTCERAIRDAAIVVTTTPSREPIVAADWLSPGTHLTAMGSDFPSKQELEVGVLAKADRVIADQVENCLRNGEIHHAVEAGALDVARVEELGDIVVGRRPGRTSPTEITVADLCGLGAQDTAIVDAVIDVAVQRGVGTNVTV